MDSIVISLALVYSALLTFYFIKRTWSPVVRLNFLVCHFVFLGLFILDLILIISLDISFIGVYSDRFIFWGLLISGGILFSVFRKSFPLWWKVYFSVYLLYPIFALTTFLLDRLMFVIISTPLLMGAVLPHLYFQNDKYEIRDNIGFFAPKQLCLYEKQFLFERRLGKIEYHEADHEDIRDLLIESNESTIQVKLFFDEKTISVPLDSY